MRETDPPSIRRPWPDRNDGGDRDGRLERLAAAWLAGLGTDRTRFAYCGDLERFRSWLATHGMGSPLAVSNRDLERFGDACADAGEADSTTARRMSALRSFFRFAAAKGEITAPPTFVWTRDAPVRTPRRGLDADDVDPLLDAASRLGSRTASLVGLMLFNGMRLDEVLGSDAADVDRRRGSTTISVGHRDGNHVIDIDRWTAAAVDRYLGDRGDGPLLYGESPTRPASRLTRFGADYLIKRAGQAAGISGPMSSNTLRRSFVTRAHDAGMAIDDIRERLGHRDVRTTRRHLDVTGPGH